MNTYIKVSTNTCGTLVKTEVIQGDRSIDITDITLADPEVFSEFGRLKITLTALALTGEALKEK